MRKVIYFTTAIAMASASAQAQVLTNGLPVGPGHFSVNVDRAGNVYEAVPYTVIPGNANTDLIDQFEIFIELGPTTGAARLNFTSGSTSFIAQTQTVRSNGTVTGSNGVINWVSEGRIIPGSNRYENRLTFSAAAPFGQVRLISALDTSSVDRLLLLSRPSSPDFSVLYFSNAANINTGMAHGVVQSSLVNANYQGWVTRRGPDLYGVINSPQREAFSISGVIDNLIVTQAEPRFPFSTVYTVFQTPGDEPSTAFAVDLSPTATTATVVFQLTGWNDVPSDPVFRNSFE